MIFHKKGKRKISHNASDWQINFDFFGNPTIRGQTLVDTTSRPDIVIFSLSTKVLPWFEETVPLERNILDAAIRKKARYAFLKTELQLKQWSVHDFTFEIGALGFISKSFNYMLNKLGFPSHQKKFIRRKAAKIALRSSFFIWSNRFKADWSPPSLAHLPKICNFPPLAHNLPLQPQSSCANISAKVNIPSLRSISLPSHALLLTPPPPPPHPLPPPPSHRRRKSPPDRTPSAPPLTLSPPAATSSPPFTPPSSPPAAASHPSPELIDDYDESIALKEALTVGHLWTVREGDEFLHLKKEFEDSSPVNLKNWTDWKSWSPASTRWFDLHIPDFELECMFDLDPIKNSLQVYLDSFPVAPIRGSSSSISMSSDVKS